MNSKYLDYKKKFAIYGYFILKDFISKDFVLNEYQSELLGVIVQDESFGPLSHWNEYGGVPFLASDNI